MKLCWVRVEKVNDALTPIGLSVVMTGGLGEFVYLKIMWLIPRRIDFLFLYIDK